MACRVSMRANQPPRGLKTCQKYDLWVQETYKKAGEKVEDQIGLPWGTR